MEAFFAGMALGLSLILAIGAQNAFVLRQGIRREHVFWIVLTCAVSDAILVIAGVSGFGVLAERVPWLAPAMKLAGAAFLIFYGAMTLRSALRGGGHLEPGQGTGSLRKALLTTLALTWLNPHVYLDTVVLLGAVSTQYSPASAFGAGAATGSFLFFFSLGYGARLLAPVFSRPRSWQVLDSFVALTMWAIALRLLLG